jgi:hypothetical protein
MKVRHLAVIVAIVFQIMQSGLQAHRHGSTTSLEEAKDQGSLPASVNDAAIFIQQEGYVERQYAKLDAAAGDYLYLEGEPISFRVGLRNGGTEPISLYLDKKAIDKGIHVELGNVTDKTWTPIPASFTRVSRPSVVTSGVIQSEVRRVEIAPQAFGALGAWLISSAPGPGTYQLRFTGFNSSCEPRCIVVNHAGLLRFEVRSTKELREQLDFLVRRAWRALDAGDAKRAKPLIEEILKLHPPSVPGYRLKGRYLERIGDRADASAAHAEALRLLKSRADTLFLWNDVLSENRAGSGLAENTRD